MTHAPDWLLHESRHDTGQRRIREAALELFRQKGVDLVTVDAVARRAGCSRATLYRVVGPRAKLIGLALSDAAAGILRDVESSVAGLAGEERAVTSVASALHCLRAQPSLHEWLLQTSVKGSLAEMVTSPAVQAHAARLSGLPDGEVVIRTVLSFIMWPGSDGDREERAIAAMLPTAQTSHPGASGP